VERTYTVNVAAGAPDASVSWVFGAGLDGPQVNEPATFFVQLADKCGNKLNKGGHNVSSMLQRLGDAAATAEVVDLENGIYAVQYTPARDGAISISIGLALMHVRDSPYTVNVVGPSSASAEGQGLHQSVAGIPADFILTVVTAAGRRCQISPKLLSASLSRIPVDSKHCHIVVDVVPARSRGQFLASYTATMSGEYTLTVLLRGSHIVGSPFPVRVEPAQVYGPASVCYGPGTTYAHTGEPAEFTIESCDRFGIPPSLRASRSSTGSFAAAVATVKDRVTYS
jgi:hypothetical protein